MTANSSDGVERVQFGYFRSKGFPAVVLLVKSALLDLAGLDNPP